MAEQDKDQARLRLKLNAKDRYKMALLASERFRSAPLREVEAAAHKHLTEILERDAHSVPASEIEILKKHGFVLQVSGFILPNKLTFREDGERRFERPDGVEVKRQSESIVIERPDGDEQELPSFGTWSEAVKCASKRTGYSDWRGLASRVTLSKPAFLPGSGNLCEEGYARCNSDRRTTRIDRSFDLDAIRSDFLSIDVMPAMVAYFKAADARIREERRLICAAIKVIASCSTYGQALDFWPEVEEIEESLFGKPVIPSAFSVVALSDADKAALCANMASRGVKGGACERAAA